MDEIFNELTSVYPNPLDRFYILVKIFQNSGYDATLKKVVSTNDDATTYLLRVYSLAYIANTIPYITFDSSTQAMNILGQITELFEAELSDGLITGNIFSWLTRIYHKAIADISTRGAQLPQVNTFRCDMLPVPVVAQYLYQDGSRDQEIVIRNNSSIRHPLFYQGDLEVLAS